MRVDYGAKIYLYYDCEELYNLTDFDEYQGNGLLIKMANPSLHFVELYWSLMLSGHW